MNTTTNLSTRKMVQLALFTAIIVILTFTPLGYINIPPLSMTLIGIPVIIGAIVLGPVAGAYLGLVFGISAFIKCFGDSFWVIFLNISVIKVFILMIIPRLLMGWLTGLVFIGFKKFDKSKLIAYPVTSLIGSLFNTVFFMTLLIVFFMNNSKFQEFVPAALNGPIALFTAVAGVNALIEAVVCTIVAGAIAKVLDKYVSKNGLK